jgi:hypothetical protein
MIPVERYTQTSAKHFGYWIFIKPSRKIDRSSKKNFIRTIEKTLGPIGVKWQYQAADDRYILKLNSEQDAVFFLLGFRDN